MTFKIILMVVMGLLVLGLLSKVFGQGSGEKNYLDVNVQEFTDLMKDENSVIIDVRTPVEAKSGIIEGAKVINLFNKNFNQQISELPKGKTYLVYCRSGNRSAKACRKMDKLGFDNLYNLTGGYISWSKN